MSVLELITVCLKFNGGINQHIIIDTSQVKPNMPILPMPHVIRKHIPCYSICHDLHHTLKIVLEVTVVMNRRWIIYYIYLNLQEQWRQEEGQIWRGREQMVLLTASLQQPPVSPCFLLHNLPHLYNTHTDLHHLILSRNVQPPTNLLTLSILLTPLTQHTVC